MGHPPGSRGCSSPRPAPRIFLATAVCQSGKPLRNTSAGYLALGSRGPDGETEESRSPSHQNVLRVLGDRGSTGREFRGWRRVVRDISRLRIITAWRCLRIGRSDSVGEFPTDSRCGAAVSSDCWGVCILQVLGGLQLARGGAANHGLCCPGPCQAMI
jgi:hypothetical protein